MSLTDAVYSLASRVATECKSIRSAIATREPTITPGTVSQFWRGDKTWQSIGSLPKPRLQDLPDVAVTTFATNALLVYDPVNFRWVTALGTKGMVGLDQVDNTADLSKPVSTAQQAAINLRAPKTPVQTGPPANPETGQLWWDTDETLTVVQGELTLADITATPPVAPTSGLRLFNRFRARRTLAMMDQFGHEVPVQPALYGTKIARYAAVNGSVTPTIDGTTITAITNNGGTQTATATTSTNFYSSATRLRFVTSTTAGVGCGIRTPAQYFLSSTAGLGGFFFVCRFGLESGAVGTRGFFGMSTQTTPYVTTTDPSAQLNQIGFGWNAAHSSIRFMSAGATTGAAANVDLGANFPTNVFNIHFFELRLYAPPGSSAVYWSATRLNDGVTTSGGPVTTDLPAVGTMLAAHMNYTNGAAAVSYGMGIQSLYIETDI